MLILNTKLYEAVIRNKTAYIKHQFSGRAWMVKEDFFLKISYIVFQRRINEC